MEKKEGTKKKQKGGHHGTDSKKPKKGVHKTGPTGAKALPGTGGNLFGYLSQAYGAAQSEETGGARGMSSLYEDSDSMAEIHSLDDQYKLLFKKIHKKDVATKVKGMAELKFVLEAKEKEDVATIAGYYIYVFNKIMATEYERRVRELANNVLGIIISKARTSLGSHITKLVPFWYLALCDPSSEVCSAARVNYDLCFPKDKQSKVFGLCFEAFLKVAHEYMKTSKESFQEDLGTISDSEKEEIYDRVLSSVLKAVSLCFGLSNGDQDLKQKYVEGVIRMLQLDEQNGSLAKLLTGKHKSGIRAAALEVIVSLLENVQYSVLKLHEAKLSEFVLYSISESNMKIQTVLWSQALVKFAKSCENCWGYLNVKKAFLNKLYQCLRKAAFGASPALYSNFIILLSLFPFLKLQDDPSTAAEAKMEVDAPEEKSEKAEVPIEETKKVAETTTKAEPKEEEKKKRRKKEESDKMGLKDQLEAMREIMGNMFAALYSEEAAIYHEKLVECYFDCCLFLLWKRILPFTETCTDKSSIEAACEVGKSLISKPLEPYFAGNLSQRTFTHLSQGLSGLFNRMREKGLTQEFVVKLESAALSRMTELFISKKQAIGEAHINLLHSLCTGVQTPSVSAAEFNFTGELVKLVQNFHQLLRTQIAEELANAHKKSKTAVTSKLHLFCLVTYKFLCVTETPLLASAYTGSSGKLLEFEWLHNSLAAPSTDPEIIQYVLLSVSAILNAIASQSQFDSLISFATDPDRSKGIRNEEGRKLLQKYAINPISVTWDLESKLIVKQGRASTKQSSDLSSLVAMMNQGEAWRISVTRRIAEMAQDRGAHDLYKPLLVSLAKAYIDRLNHKFNIDNRIMGSLVEVVYSRALACDSKEGCKLVEELVMSFISPLITNKGVMEKSDSLQTVCDKFCREIIVLLYRHNKYIGTTSRVWDLLRKLINPSLYSSAISHLYSLTHEFLQSPKRSEEEISLFIQFIRAFLLVSGQREITVLQDLFFPTPEQSEQTCRRLFSSLQLLRIFNELFLRGGVGSNIPDMLMRKGEDGSFPYVGICCEILKSLFHPCTGRTVGTRNQITLYTDIELIPYLSSADSSYYSLEIKAEYIKLVVSSLIAKARVTAGSLYSYALQHLLSQLLLAQSEERTFLESRIYEEIFVETVLANFESILAPKTEGDRSTYSLVALLISCVEPELAKVKSEQYLVIYLDKLKKSVEAALGDPGSEQFANAVGLLAASASARQIDPGFHHKVFSAAVASLPQHSLGQRCRVFEYIEAYFRVCGGDCKEIMPVIISGITSCEKEDRIVPEFIPHICGITSYFIEHYPLSLNLDLLSGRLVEFTYLKCQEYKLRVESEAPCVFELEYEMFQLLGSLLRKCAKYVTPSVSEELLYSLIGSNIESIQKSGYLLLKQIYANSLPLLHYPAQEKWDIGTFLEGDQEELKEALEQSKYDDLNKNIPLSLIEMLEKIPSVAETYQDTLKESKKGATSIEVIILSADEEGKEEDQFALLPEMYGYLLCWNSLLHKVYYGWLHCRKEKNDDYLSVLNSISVFLSHNKTYYEIFLVFLSAYLPTSSKFVSGLKEEDVLGFDPCKLDLQSGKDICKFSLFCLFNFMKNYPSLARNFSSQCDPVIGKLIASAVSKIVSPAIWFAEASNLHNCQEILKENQIEVTMMNTTREIMASISKDDVEFSMSLKFPANYPLKSIEVAHLTTGILTEFEMKTWNLSMNRLISSQNCDVLGALMLWKANYDKKFEGVEPCPICYSIVHVDTYSIPSLQCKTCKNKFHAACMKRWFRESHKNKCPFCQNYFF